jgi:hypothetical protein
VEEGEVAKGREVGTKCLIEKVWSDKIVNKEALQSVLPIIWRTLGGVKFKDLKDNVWLFEFADKNDKRRVMNGKPRSFDRHMLVLNEFDGSIKSSQLEFTRSPLWIQVHDMSLLCMSVGTKVGTS